MMDSESRLTPQPHVLPDLGGGTRAGGALMDSLCAQARVGFRDVSRDGLTILAREMLPRRTDIPGWAFILC